MKLYVGNLSFILYMALCLAHSVSFSQVDINVFRDEGDLFSDRTEDVDQVINLRLSFNDDWRFILGEVPGFFDPGFDDSSWRTLELPHDWSIEGAFDENNPSGANGGFLPMGIGCYRKTFRLPDTFKGKRIKIRFDGVYMNSSVYLNGKFLGNRPFGFSTFEYDLTPHLLFDGESNVLAVKVDNSLQQSSRWYTGSGINRNVHLYVTEQQYFRSFSTFFRTVALEDGIARLKLDGEIISNNYPESMGIRFQRFPEDWKQVVKDARIVMLLKDREGNIYAEKSRMHRLGDYETLEISMEMDVSNPILWSHKNPYLYTLELQLWIEDKLINSKRQRVGIRMVQFDKDHGMLVNGEKVIVKGVCLHKDAGSFGTAVPKDVWRYRLEKLREMGCNAIRSHCPGDPVFTELCDEMGFYMMPEAFDEWERTWQYGWSDDPAGKRDYTYHKYFRQWAETDLKDMVKRDRNHPSVVMYSVGNEVPEQRYADGVETLKMLMNWVKEEDDTRPVLASCDWAPWANANGFLDAMDIASYNYPNRYFAEHYREERARYPDRILLGAENHLTLDNWLMVRDNPYVVGLFLWVGIDYIGEALRWPRRGWEWGLIDVAGFEKPMYYYWQAFWSEKPMVHIAAALQEKDKFPWRGYNVASHWNFPPSEVDTVFVYSNTEQVELFQNGKSLGRKNVNPDTYQAIFRVNYEEGELTAKAYNKGHEVAIHTLLTAGEPEKLILKKERSSMVNDPENLLFLTLEIQDKNGVRCPFANNEISVDVSGAGQLIGLDSGNQFSHELYKQNVRKAHEGRLLLTIKPDKEGLITVTCHSEHLESFTFTTSNSN